MRCINLLNVDNIKRYAPPLIVYLKIGQQQFEVLYCNWKIGTDIEGVQWHLECFRIRMLLVGGTHFNAPVYAMTSLSFSELPSQ